MDLSTVVLYLGIGGIFVGVLLSLTAVGVFTNESRGVSKSLAVLEAFTAAPAALKKEIESSFNDRVLTPFLDRFIGLGKKLTPADHSERIRHRLELAGNPPGWTIDRVTSLKFVGFVAGLGLALMVAVGFGLSFLPVLGVCVLAAVLGYLAPNMYLYQKGYDRTQSIQ